jgi:hypothetical protein
VVRHGTCIEHAKSLCGSWRGVQAIEIVSGLPPQRARVALGWRAALGEWGQLAARLAATSNSHLTPTGARNRPLGPLLRRSPLAVPGPGVPCLPFACLPLAPPRCHRSLFRSHCCPVRASRTVHPSPTAGSFTAPPHPPSRWMRHSTARHPRASRHSEPPPPPRSHASSAGNTLTVIRGLSCEPARSRPITDPTDGCSTLVAA